MVTVTPGRTPPDGSVTLPKIEPIACALAQPGVDASTAATSKAALNIRSIIPSWVNERLKVLIPAPVREQPKFAPQREPEAGMSTESVGPDSEMEYLGGTVFWR